jgi:MoxR-like ATPase
VPKAWRIFATMNSYDKTSLYEMSYAFMRRFAFIRVDAPDLPEDETDLETLMREYATVWEIDTSPQILRTVGRVWRAMNNAVDDRAIGPAIVMDILSYVIEQPATALEIRITRAIMSYIFPQLEGVPQREQIVRQLAAVDSVDEDMLAEAATEMLQVSLTSDE